MHYLLFYDVAADYLERRPKRGCAFAKKWMKAQQTWPPSSNGWRWVVSPNIRDEVPWLFVQLRIGKGLRLLGNKKIGHRICLSKQIELGNSVPTVNGSGDWATPETYPSGPFSFFWPPVVVRSNRRFCFYDGRISRFVTLRARRI